MNVNISDLHTFAESVPITINNVPVGTLLAEYEVHMQPELRNLELQRAYAVSVRMRLRLAEGYEYAPKKKNSYRGYPAAIFNSLALDLGADAGGVGLSPFLLDYFPQTINSEINTSRANSSSVSKADAVQRTSGSSTTDTNSYEVSGNIGFQGWMGIGGASYSQGGSTAHTRNAEFMQGSTTNVDRQSSMSASMSLKDWAVYAQVDPKNKETNWLWGQEYPWNVLTYCDVTEDKDKTEVNLPDYVRERMVYGDAKTGTHVTPPSQLSLYGVNFYASAEWLIRADDVSQRDEKIRVRHLVKYFIASHFLDAGHLLAELKVAGLPFEWSSEELNLPVLGLDPIVGRGAAPGAESGFSPQEFFSPASENERFRITSAANTLYITGTGFTLPVSNNDVMLANVGGRKAQFEIKFKIIDLDSPLALYIKHWKTTERGCKLHITINETNRITRHVNAFDNGDGSDNLTTILLLQKAYTSDGYYNYLKLGLNTILVEIEPDTGASGATPGSSECGYALRAVAIA